MSFECKTCRKQFAVAPATLAKYPSWKPEVCLTCRNNSRSATRNITAMGGTSRGSAARRQNSHTPSANRPRPSATKERDLCLQEVLATYTGGPKTGVFTDGASHPNPGAGGWGAVYVVDDCILGQAHGADPVTTNNRMELTALIAGYELVPVGTPATVLTDSKLCVDTINQWAAGWKKNGWKRKSGPIKNLDLIKQLYSSAQARPDIELQWIKAHSGNRWNEFADALSTAYRRDVL